MSKLTLGNVYSGFKVTRITYVREIGADLYEMEHQRSGAGLVYIDADDNNKVFSVFFKTLPEDSTGVFHILEHSVLCGSKRYPVKEPFVDMLKGSMATFLNAITFPDKTGYPVASCNDRDFANLMSVYLDAVFAPKVCEREEIFMQEGWHYEIEDPAGPMTYKGVVFNEMKGAYSSVDRRMMGCIDEALYPDSPYRHSSGGAPANIPDLTYEQFVAAYRKYYHPENSYMFLYGDMDVEERLAYIDTEYLSKYERTGRCFDIPMQSPVVNDDVRAEYPVTQSDPLEGNSYITYSCVVGDYSEKEKLLALDIIASVLTSTNDSPLKRIFLESGMAADMNAYVADGIAQPYLVFALRKTDADRKEKFENMLFAELRRIAAEGIDKTALRAELNQAEFRMREGRQGGSPKGLGYNFSVLSSWLYGGRPELYLEYEEMFEHLKAGVDGRYFEDLIENCILQNDHHAVVVMTPSRTLSDEEAKAEADRIAAYRATLTDGEIAALCERTKALVEFQSAVDTPEQKATVPALALSDVSDTIVELPCRAEDYNGRTLLVTETDTKGIAYVNYYFDVSHLPLKYLPYANLFCSLAGQLSTKKHTAAQLDTAIKTHIGSFGTPMCTFTKKCDINDVTPMVSIRAGMLGDDIPAALDLMDEIIRDSVFDRDEIGKLITQRKNSMQMSIAQRGNSFASNRVQSYCTTDGAYVDKLWGIGFYRHLSALAADLDGKFDEIKEGLEAVVAELTRANLTIGITGDAELIGAFRAAAPSFAEGVPADGRERYLLKPEYHGNEAFVIPAGINYVAKGFNYIDAQLGIDPKRQVLSKILALDWLWNEVRVRGGAYGVSFGVSANGSATFSSYRDPSVARTIGAYDGTVEYLSNFAEKTPDITKYIISTAAGYERPRTPSSIGSSAQSNYFEGYTDDDRRADKRAVMETTPADIEAMIAMMQKLSKDGYCAVVGSREKIEEAGDIFTVKEDI